MNYDKEEYQNISEEELEKICAKKADEYFYKKAIVIWVRN